ncbi:hypothetical protein CTA2_11475 [Colletotrichum tanaceti]|uniref:Uncharacterized protein n=1 Tax=Colletotrichum tanaceti TaxID=1306861 RepID=A0A4V6DGI8_9PEZI|nr:hypothetical protein CTA2_11475 [Colletotrichum tanaceti]TKW52916.1 hypothetical protein CTA1_12454 [Colletotrichum tanaceti]
MNHAAFRILGVSLPTPPWPDQPVRSAAVLLHPSNERRLGQHCDLRTVRDRQRRIYVNLVVLFRLVNRCQHLAFDHDNFWPFIAQHWSIPIVGPKNVEDLVDIYAERRRGYLDSQRKYRHRDLLTDLIDAWNSRDPPLSPSLFPSRHRTEAEWDRIEASWLDELRYDHHLLLDESNPPHLGTFPLGHKTPSAFQIKGGSRRPASPGPSKSLFERITGPSAAHNPVHPATNNTVSPKTPTPKLPVKAVEENLIQSESRKRRFDLETPPSSSAKRQCVPGPESPLHPPPLEQQRTPETPSILESLKAPQPNKQDTQEAPTSKGPKPAEHVDDNLADTIQSEPSSTVNDEAQSCRGQQTASPTYDSELLKTLETRIQEHGREVQMLKEQTDLFLESGELSRDVRKAHDQLTIFTASQCQKALETLDELSSHISGMGREIRACLGAGQELQRCQAKQESLIDGYKGGLKSVDWGLQEVQKTLLAQSELQQTHKKSTQEVEARLSQLETKIENPAGVWLPTKEGVESRLSALETQVKKRVDERIGKIEKASLSHWYKGELEARLQTIEESLTINTTLINNCRTLVEVSKTSLDQHLGSLSGRVQLLEHRFSNFVALQTKTNNEQAKRLELVEAEPKTYKQAASSQSRERSTRPSGSDLADVHAQLNALRNSLAVVARNQRADQAERVVATPSPPVSQLAIDDPSRRRQSKPSSSSVQITSDLPVVKEES